MLSLFALVWSCGGCYYSHLASGQIKILWQRQPIDEAIHDPAHPRDVRQLLMLVESVRRFADSLGLEVGNQYTSYVDWPGDRIVTTLVRTRPGSLTVEKWWFPMVGQLPYKGYFDRERAEAEARELREEEDFDVCVSAVPAYSTLGWVDDPVTQPMLRRGAASLVETLLHELVHATAFVAGEADFNEGVAQFIGQQAAIQFFEQHSAPPEPVGGPGESVIRVETSQAGNEAKKMNAWPSADRVRRAIEDRQIIAESTLALRDRLVEIDGHPEREKRREQEVAKTRAELAALPLQVIDAARVAEVSRLSDACLALRGTYVRDGPRHARVFQALGGELPAMIGRLRLWAEEERPLEDFFKVGVSLNASRQAGAQDIAPGNLSGL